MRMAWRPKWKEYGLLLLAFAASTFAAPHEKESIGAGCVYNEHKYTHGDTWFPQENNDCFQCQCLDGKVQCQF
ncbi:unnamed protein product, partial [Candidula unifasciata]